LVGVDFAMSTSVNNTNQEWNSIMHTLSVYTSSNIILQLI
jgi:hypothetical protein